MSLLCFHMNLHSFDCGNVSVKFSCVYVCLLSGDLFIFSVRVSSFYFYFCLILYILTLEVRLVVCHEWKLWNNSLHVWNADVSYIMFIGEICNRTILWVMAYYVKSFLIWSYGRYLVSHIEGCGFILNISSTIDCLMDSSQCLLSTQGRRSMN